MSCSSRSRAAGSSFGSRSPMPTGSLQWAASPGSPCSATGSSNAPRADPMAGGADSLIGVTRDDAAVTITLQRPDKKNALSIALRDEISDALDELAADETVKVVVFTGAGNVFSAGFDLSEFPRALEDAAF